MGEKLGLAGKEEAVSLCRISKPFTSEQPHPIAWRAASRLAPQWSPQQVARTGLTAVAGHPQESGAGGTGRTLALRALPRAMAAV